MTWKTKRVAAATVAISITALLLAGCGGDEGPTEPPPQDIPAAVVGDLAKAMAQSVDQMIATVPGVASGNVGGGPLPKTAEREPTQLVQEPSCSSAGYDQEQGAWIWACTDTSEAGTSSYDYFVQFLATDTPQQAPDSTTTEVTYGLAWNWDYAVMEEGYSFDWNYMYDFAMNITDLREPSYHVVGSGSSIGDWSSTTPEGSQAYAINMTWTTNVYVPAEGGCRTGTTTVTMGVFDLIVTYDGTTTYSWILLQNGEETDSGTEATFCTPPPGLN